MLYIPALITLTYVLKGFVDPDIDTPFVMSVELKDIERGTLAIGLVWVVVS